MSALVRLYPRAWRDRYGVELEDLVSYRPLGLSGSIDLVRGALDAHRHPELVDPTARSAWDGPEAVSPQRLADLRVARRLGSGSLLGAAAWLAGYVVMLNGPIVTDGNGTYRDGSAGAPLILLAMGLLSAGLLGQLIRLPRQARVGRLGALVGLVSAPIWGLGPWILSFGLAALGGIVALALGAAWARTWGWPSVFVVLASFVVAVTFGVIAVVGMGGRGVDILDPVSIMFASLTPIWLVVGVTLRSLPPVDQDPSPELSPSHQVASA